MNCLRCGKVNPDNAMYCTSCGNPLSNGQSPASQVSQPELGSITIIRPKNFYGCLIAYDVFIDNYYMGQVKNGETKQFQVYYGNHNIVIKQGLNSGSQMVTIHSTQRNFVFNCPLQVGLVTCTILFHCVNIYN